MFTAKGYFIKPPKTGITLDSEDFIFNLRVKKLAVSTEFGISVVGIEIKFVHALQNLYFSLTGEELTLKD